MGLCWISAVVIFVFIGLGATSVEDKRLAFVYAVPASAIVTLVFSCIWHYRWVRILSITVLIWTVLTCVYLTALVCGVDLNAVPVVYVYFIGIPLQVLAVIFFSPWKKPFLHNVTGNN